MRYVFVGYVYTGQFSQPQAWLKRINVYSGIQGALSKENEVISIEQIDYDGQHFSSGVDYRFMRYGKLSLRYFPWGLNKFIRSLKPDVVVVHSFNSPQQVLLLRLILGRSIKIIVQNHAERPATGIKKLLQKIADKGIDAYLFASYAMGVEWVAAGNLASVNKIHEVMEVSSVFYPIDREIARQQTGVSGNPVFLWVGRLNANKDPLTVVSAFLRFAAVEPQARLYMIYQTEELLGTIKALLAAVPGLADRVILVGTIPHKDLLYWFNSADFILSGSHYEGSGASVCEAMSCGCVPVVTDILSFRMITNNGHCGLLYPTGNLKALLDALHKTRQMNLPQQRQRSLDYFRTNLSFEAIARQIAQIAQSL
ncbi:glycosyltransferase family 4 protein [Mucilaginibacter psychrotolerans]|uniref:Glycosyltransferase n=1 Tax=Mucilaginibacter psychrotolerans TaxID=1524096 RepID=A0A4Y8SHR1_9SPHI|nr:glycosyltransferase family 4 protein [Mucilaginibacter psychrotolerans]TFF38221.1 glycosyltransferase [Mucilaginibacter psychrotolerans]